MTPPAIVALLRQTIGLNPDAIGTETIARAVHQRMTQGAVSNIQAYLERLRTSQQELQALIDAVVVPETWFFRDQVPFTYLGRYVTAEWLPTHAHVVLRVLSMACATGEEPYSIAMTLLDTGLAPQHFCIEAVDISHQALRQAQRAVYGRHSFRGEDRGFRERYLEPSEAGYRIRDRVRHRVTFIQGNILEAHWLADREPYDVIFCRNMLIYFDDAAKTRALRILENLLRPHGVLFVGYAETALLLAAGYVPVRDLRAFAYCKAAEPHTGQPVPQLPRPMLPRTRHGQSHHLASPRRCQRFPYPSASVGSSPAPPTPRSPHTPALETARQLADQGDVDVAAMLCEQAMHEHGPSAQAYFLLGLIRQATGNAEQAEYAFNRAVYLQPDHYEALVHLALLRERCGDTAGAAVMRQRAQRVQHNAR